MTSDYVVVPRVATETMLTALNGYACCAGYLEEGYSAMVNAAPSPWKPISEAPKDGTPLLLALPAFGEGPTLILTVGSNDGDFWVDESGHDLYPPTHFMPLPAPPSNPT